jgi:replicative DNA helicase
MNENGIDEFEQCFLGSLLLANPKELPQLKVKPHYFSNSKNGKIFQAYQKQIGANIAPDIGTLCFDPDLADIGKDYIAALNTKISSAANLQFYESEIIKAWQLRICNFGNEKFQEKLKTTKLTGEIEQTIIEYIGILSGALCDKHTDSFLTFDDYINTKAKKEYWKEYTPKLFGSLPFPNSTISMIGAAPGSGKTAAEINLCRELLTTEPTGNPRPGEPAVPSDKGHRREARG